MVDVNGKHYYIYEAARLKTGDWIVPVKWYRVKEALYMDAHPSHLIAGLTATLCRQYGGLEQAYSIRPSLVCK